MMPHEHDREIHKLREMVVALEFRVKTAERDITALFATIQIQQKQIEELYGQADKQDCERPEKGHKGHKKAP